MVERTQDETTWDGGEDEPIDEAQLFETLCELEPEAQAQRLIELDRTHPELSSRLRRLLAIDEAYGTHTARSVMVTELPDPLGDISDIGAFRLVRQIGRGGMGVVYLAERRSGFEQQVAIKIMPRFAIDDASRERFAQERRILAQLRHPNICSILDGGELADGTPWLAMEYVPGESLCAWCARHRSDARERIALFLQLCDAVQYAHRNLVIHRDLKDSNVMIDERGAVKLLDFGIAKSLSAMADAGQTAMQDRFFSPMTAAPEQLRGERATVAVDVYALGALLHQLLCGVLPFERPQRDPTELQRAILDTVPPRMSDVLARERAAAPSATGAPPAPSIGPQALRGELDAIVAHCLRKDASERYAEVGDLARDLRAWLSGHPISISRNDRLYRIGKFLRRNRVGAAVVAVAAGSVLIALAVTLWQASELRAQRDAAQQARARSESDRDRARAVAAFMRGTFEQADPGNASAGGLLARELIEQGKRRLGELDGQKDVQAEQALLLAEIDAGLGLLRESDATFRAHAPAIEALSAVDPDVRWRARLLRFSNRRELDTDGPHLDAELAALKRLADTPQAHVQAARQEERLAVRRSEFDRAARILEDAWRRYATKLDAPSVLRLRINLGDAMLSSDRMQEARRICEGIDRDALRAHDPALQILALALIVRELDARVQDSLAQDQPDDTDAATLRANREALVQAIADRQATAERLYGSDSIQAASAYVWSVGVATDRQRQEALMQKAYAIQRAKLPPVSSARAYAEFVMARYYLDLRDRPDLAEPHLAQAVAIGRKVSSRAHSDVAQFELEWARTLNALGRHRVCLEQLAAPPDNPENLKAAGRLSELHLELAKAAIALRQPAQARAEIATVNALWRRLGKPLPPRPAEALRAVERSLAAIGDGA
ncbi:MAG: serine/threonine-protein kinase [Pseudomonadota bacterium]